jgi:hypothetical protein
MKKMAGAADAIAFYAELAEPFGHEWGLATPKEGLSACQIGRRAELSCWCKGGAS